MVYRLLFLAALLGIANAVESCYFCYRNYFRQVYLLLSEAIEVKAIKVIDKVEPHGEKCCKNDGEKQN